MSDTMTNCWTKGEAKVARRLIRALLAEGATISLYDGEEWVVRKTTGEKKILAGMASTGTDTIVAHRDETRLAAFSLIYGNAEDGSEVIADYTDNPFADRLCALAYGPLA